MVPQNTEKKSALRTNSPLKTRLLKEEYLHIKPLMNTNHGKPKNTATTLAFGKFSGSAISMLSEESDW